MQLRQIAKELNIGYTTLLSWGRNPEYVSAVNEALQHLESEATKELQQGYGDAVKKARELLNSQSESIALGAAKLILNTMNHVVERRESAARWAEMSEQMEVLEKRLALIEFMPSAHDVELAQGSIEASSATKRA
ncbi:RNA polymerase subunit sigma-70 [Cyanobium gracile UHCC 0139]|uniref:RNA polymerase subunit sigma-70 n=1 Tax=Cyanobium gracile UHCC 0139 TaxID=3110308 RepID=A0ABU5RWJ8_9CYAN|nr:RNA polymerase subunit sigma-70 [Cyanobium gracile]MEA5392149.1 RNA polymerase subunit sigma-70 [Cyanobium gracile UHCC 0139]